MKILKNKNNFKRAKDLLTKILINDKINPECTDITVNEILNIASQITPQNKHQNDECLDDKMVGEEVW